MAKESRNKKSVGTWSLYMYKQVKQVHCDSRISNKAASDDTSLINDVIHEQRNGRGVSQGSHQCGFRMPTGS